MLTEHDAMKFLQYIWQCDRRVMTHIQLSATSQYGLPDDLGNEMNEVISDIIRDSIRAEFQQPKSQVQSNIKSLIRTNTNTNYMLAGR